MKVLVIQESGGRFDFCFGRRLTDAGVQIRFLYKSGSPAVEQQRRQGIQADALPFRSRLDIQTLLALRTIIREYKPDIIHSHAAKTCFLAIVAQWPHKLTRIVFLRGAIRRFNPLSPSDVLIFRSHWVDLFHCVSHTVAASLVPMGVPSTKIAVAPNFGYETAWFQDLSIPPEFERRPGTFRIGAVANYRKVKGLEFLVKAADILFERGLVFELFLVGKDENDSLAACAAQAKAREDIHLTGPIANPWRVLQTFDCLVVPSLSEGLGLAAIEGMACGVPVVATRVGGLSEIIQHGGNGYLVPPANPTELADAIQRILTNVEFSGKLRKGACKTFREKFTAEKVSEQLLEMYRQAINI